MNRQRLIRFVGLGAALALAGTAGAQTDHSPAPMMAPAKAPLSEEAYREQQAPGGRQEDADTITARFSGAGIAPGTDAAESGDLKVGDRITAVAEERVEGLAIEDNSGEYLSPYTSDGVTAEWVNKAINAKMGSAAGSAVGAAAGAYTGRKALESVPGGSIIGSFFGGKAGSKAGQSMGRDAAIQASGGWDYIRETSDLSFQSLNDMARWMTTVHGQKSNFQEVLKATLQVYRVPLASG